MNSPDEIIPDDQDPYKQYEDEDEVAISFPAVKEVVDGNATLIDQQPAYTRIINAEVQLQHQDNLITGKGRMR
eukprot:6292469-Ditylum_brightwellii.AAC.1